MKHLQLFLALALSASIASAQTVDSVKKKGLTLIFKNNEPSFSLETKQRLIDAFFEVYPKEVAEYNPRSLTRVTFFVDTAYKGVAATGGGVVRYNPKWFVTHPEDIDVVTHEVMHIVQSYGRGARGAGWLTEG